MPIHLSGHAYALAYYKKSGKLIGVAEFALPAVYLKSTRKVLGLSIKTGIKVKRFVRRTSTGRLIPVKSYMRIGLKRTPRSIFKDVYPALGFDNWSTRLPYQTREGLQEELARQFRAAKMSGRRGGKLEYGAILDWDGNNIANAIDDPVDFTQGPDWIKMPFVPKSIRLHTHPKPGGFSWADYTSKLEFLKRSNTYKNLDVVADSAGNVFYTMPTSIRVSPEKFEEIRQEIINDEQLIDKIYDLAKKFDGRSPQRDYEIADFLGAYEYSKRLKKAGLIAHDMQLTPRYKKLVEDYENYGKGS